MRAEITHALALTYESSRIIFQKPRCWGLELIIACTRTIMYSNAASPASQG